MLHYNKHTEDLYLHMSCANELFLKKCYITALLQGPNYNGYKAIESSIKVLHLQLKSQVNIQQNVFRVDVVKPTTWSW